MPSRELFLSHPLVVLLLLPFLLLAGAPCSAQAAAEAAERESWAMKPVAAPPGAAALMLEETRRRLGSFQICALCTCCGGPRGVCLPSPCCYAINCNIPNRPFGFCSFTPKSCNCLECSL